MLKAYPDFRKSRIDSSRIQQQLSISELSVVDEFIRYCSITAGAKKCRDIRSILLQTRFIIERDFSHWTLAELREFLALLNASGKRDWTTQGIRIVLKKFIRWHFKDWSLRFNNLEDIRLKHVSTQDKYSESNLLTKDEVERLIRAAETLREKAMLMILFESACRPQELCNLKWKDVALELHPVLLTLYSGKTSQSRTLPIREAVLHLRRWRQEWCFPSVKATDFVFPGQVRSKPIATYSLDYLLKKIANKAAIEKPVFAYLFRHSRGSELYDKLPEQQAKKLMGHQRDSRMVGVYAHGTDRTAIQAMLKEIYGVTEMTEDQRTRYDEELDTLKRELAEIRPFLRSVRQALSAAKFKLEESRTSRLA